MFKTAREIVAFGDERLVVDYAVEADRQIKATKAELETAKDFLRVRAADIVAHTNEPTAQIKGSNGTAIVSFQKPQAAVRKGVDLLAYEQTMDPSVWNTFFRKRVVVEVADDVEAKLAALTPAQRAAVLNLIEIRTDVPRVTVKQG